MFQLSYFIFQLSFIYILLFSYHSFIFYDSKHSIKF